MRRRSSPSGASATRSRPPGSRRRRRRLGAAMFRSLRFRLPAIFLAAIALAGLVSTLIALRLFPGYSRDQSLAELRGGGGGGGGLFFWDNGEVDVRPPTLQRTTRG